MLLDDLRLEALRLATGSVDHPASKEEIVGYAKAYYSFLKGDATEAKPKKSKRR